jgi:hypothetical protein
LALNCGFSDVSITPQREADFAGFQVIVDLRQGAFFAEELARLTAFNASLQGSKAPAAPLPR